MRSEYSVYLHQKNTTAEKTSTTCRGYFQGFNDRVIYAIGIELSDKRFVTSGDQPKGQHTLAATYLKTKLATAQVKTSGV